MTIRELWRKRTLISNFAITDLRIRYRNSIIGFFWTFLEPLLMLTVLYFVFTNIFETNIENFPLYILLGIIMYNMFSKGTIFGLNSMIARSTVLTHIYFPREIPAISGSITSFIMTVFELIIFGIFMMIFQFIPTETILVLPLIIALEFILIVGLSLPLSLFSIRYRDIQFIWTILIQIGFFLTPIFYKSDILPEFLQEILSYSPIFQIVNMAHDVTLYNTLPEIESVLKTVIVTGIIFGIGYGIFKKYQAKIIEEL
ncbi:MAG: ABC transporter permease [Nitrosopumilus sp.]|nr:ABC transporter permease [Nitrosopumilus sp.]